MSKAMFGFAAVVAVAISPAWANDEWPNEEPARDAVAVNLEADSEDKTTIVRKSATPAVLDTGRDSGAMEQSTEVRASRDEQPKQAERSEQSERWLREREGYRDGGY